MELLQHLCDFTNLIGVIPQSKDNDIIPIYLQTSGLDFLFSMHMDYAGRDRMTLGGLLTPNKQELLKIIENFKAIIQSGTHVILDNQSVTRIWVFRPFGGGAFVQSLDN